MKKWTIVVLTLIFIISNFAFYRFSLKRGMDISKHRILNKNTATAKFIGNCVLAEISRVEKNLRLFAASYSKYSGENNQFLTDKILEQFPIIFQIDVFKGKERLFSNQSIDPLYTINQEKLVNSFLSGDAKGIGCSEIYPAAHNGKPSFAIGCQENGLIIIFTVNIEAIIKEISFSRLIYLDSEILILDEHFHSLLQMGEFEKLPIIEKIQLSDRIKSHSGYFEEYISGDAKGISYSQINDPRGIYPLKMSVFVLDDLKSLDISYRVRGLITNIVLSVIFMLILSLTLFG